jgi:hypothetical protein
VREAIESFMVEIWVSRKAARLEVRLFCRNVRLVEAKRRREVSCLEAKDRKILSLPRLI